MCGMQDEWTPSGHIRALEAALRRQSGPGIHVTQIHTPPTEEEMQDESSPHQDRQIAHEALQRVEKDHSKLKAELQETQERRSQLEINLRRIREERDDLKSQLEQIRNHSEISTHQHRSLSDERERRISVENSLAEHKGIIHGLREQIAVLKESFSKELERSREWASKMFGDGTEKLRAANTEIGELEDKIETLQKALEAAGELNEQLRKDNDNMNTEFSSVQEMHREFLEKRDGEIERLQRKLDRAQDVEAFISARYKEIDTLCRHHCPGLTHQLNLKAADISAFASQSSCERPCADPAGCGTEGTCDCQSPPEARLGALRVCELPQDIAVLSPEFFKDWLAQFDN